MKDKILNSGFIRKISSWPLCCYFSEHPFFGKFMNYEVISYLICGILTTVVNYVVYFLMPRFPSDGLDIVLANVVAWIAAVLFAFVVNKVFVFDSGSWSASVLWKELIPFLTCRLLSLAMDTLIMWFFCGILHWNEPIMKIVSNIFVMLANYFASKYLIFKK